MKEIALLLLTLIIGIVLGAWVVAMCVSASRKEMEQRYGIKTEEDHRDDQDLAGFPQREKPPQGPCRPVRKNDG